ncbi:hypothetical protein [Terrimonas alba]|uniref:hypothetical protein n=1 Tax=Terrimonas alba TaxID=3349636 RepID=UPI0035F42C2E
MNIIEENVNQLRHEITEEEAKVKEAIQQGIVFEEVKKMNRYIKILKARLGHLLKETDPNSQ